MKTRLHTSDTAPNAPTADDVRSAEEMLRAADKALREAATDTQAVDGPQAGPPPTSDRPISRTLIAGVLAFGLCVTLCTMWSTFFRYSAHGVVAARTAELAAPWSGTIEAVHVRPGQAVQQGDLLATVVDRQLDASIERLRDELRTAEAELGAETARLGAELLTQQDRQLQLTSQYLDLLGRLGVESATAEELTASQARIEPLVASAVVPEQEIESLRFRQAGSRSRLESLRQAVAALETRLAQQPSPERHAALLRPWVAKVEQLNAEIARLEEQRDWGQLRAPFAGSVVRVAAHVGEACGVDRPVLELLDQNSMELTIYVPLDQVDDFPVGRRVQARSAKSNATLACEVLAVGPALTTAPVERAGDDPGPPNKAAVYLGLPQELPRGLTLRAGESVSVLTSWWGG
ncbi:Multidrug resistance protein MdtN [Posidoniimonas polymericola]|uniref:Multidrug resistance protein MdtN n=1 Tax=Posidoniimonas polymericola TaxID=2528002 RepID=A0A5C5YAG0_9BACT|nr:HlyD family efflux transporter periplasmic adaptor subunit [Posidoniimonas polymericola]TWT72686.1 Multidrug resistance protein MdtN [Posidoniimonas polymericola]